MLIRYGISYIFFFKQKTAYEMRSSDWSSDVCSSDLKGDLNHGNTPNHPSSRSHGAGKNRTRSPGTPAHGAPDGLRCRRGTYRRQPVVCRERRNAQAFQTGRASGRERVCRYVSISVVGGSLKKKNTSATKDKQVIQTY